MNLKEDILKATDGGRKIFEDLYGEEARRSFQTNGKHKIKIRDEKTPSVSFKLVKPASGTPYWILSDFGTGIYGINAIDAYMSEKGIRFFNEALYKLADEYNVNRFLDAGINKQKVRFEEYKEGDKQGQTTWETKEISDEELAVMGATVTREVMEKHHYQALKSYRRVGEKKVAIVESTPDYPVYLHECYYTKTLADGTEIKEKFAKIYKPLEIEKANRFFYIGAVPKNYIYGLEEAKQELQDRLEAYNDYLDELKDKTKAAQKAGLSASKKLPEIIICSGERDAMCLAGLGYIPVWFNSETAKKTNEDIDKLYRIASKIYNIPDKDETGIAMGRTFALDHMSIYTIELPQWLSSFSDARKRPCKDLRDYIDIRPDKWEFIKLLNSAQCAKFWETNEENGRTRVEIKALNLLYFLKLNGFYKYKDPLTKEIKLVRVDGYVVTEYDPVQIRDFVRNELYEQQVGNQVMEAYINSKKASKQIYDDLETIDIDFESSTQDSRTFFFRNVCVRVTAPTDPNNPDTGIEILKKPKNNKYVWSTKIIPHNFHRIPQSFNYDWQNSTLEILLQNNPSKVMRYLINASRLYWREELEKLCSQNPNPDEARREDQAYYEQHQYDLYGPRLVELENMDDESKRITDARANQALCFLNKIYTNGYLIHGHKIASNAKAIWAMEWKNQDEGASNGRSGKSLMISAITKIGLSEVVTLNGRNKKLTDNNHLMDRVSKSTDILLIDDARKGFDFDTFYAMITGSITINPKNESSFELKYEDAPNIVFTSNFPVPNTEASTLDRMLFVAFSDYYHTKGEDTDYLQERKVSDEVGLLFDANYAEDDYNADINFYIDCLLFYLSCMKLNVKPIQPPTDSIFRRAKRGQIGEPMYRWAVEFFDPESDHLNVCLIKQAVYDDYSRSIKRGEELKGSNSFMRAIRNFAKMAEHIEEINPETHPYMHADGRMSAKATYSNKTQAWELIYMKTTDAEDLSKSIATI